MTVRRQPACCFGPGWEKQKTQPGHSAARKKKSRRLSPTAAAAGGERQHAPATIGSGPLRTTTMGNALASRYSGAARSRTARAAGRPARAALTINGGGHLRRTRLHVGERFQTAATINPALIGRNRPPTLLQDRRGKSSSMVESSDFEARRAQRSVFKARCLKL